MGAAAKSLDKQINSFLEVLNTRQKKALLTVAKTFVEEQESDWSDEFKVEMDKRYEDYKRDGKVVSRATVTKKVNKLLGKSK